MSIEDAATEICEILEMLQDSQRLAAMQLVKEEYCFHCGSHHQDCTCWNDK
jgi:hypothetical protein